MKIELKFYTGPFCNTPRNPTEEEDFHLHPINQAFLNPDYPFLNQFLIQVADTGICFGISLWKIETSPESAATLSPTDVKQLITAPELLAYQYWQANAHEGEIVEKKNNSNHQWSQYLGDVLYRMQVYGSKRPPFPRKFCEGLAQEFLQALEAESGEMRQFFHIQYGWSNWFALDSHNDHGFLFVTEQAYWLLTFSESD